MKRLKMGMVGGGIGAFIGNVHRIAARIDGGIDLVAGAFDVVPERGREQGRLLGLDPARVYDTYTDMIAGESARPAGDRIDCVAVCTPNFTHFPIAKACLEAGFHVMCEKPMTMTSAEAEELAAFVARTGLVFGVMHTYVGYPMVKLARDLVARGDLGTVSKVVVQYPQGWMRRVDPKNTSVERLVWRMDPRKSGISGCMADIGTHAANLAEYVTGLKIVDVLSDLSNFVGGALDDDGDVLLRMEHGVKGVLIASQISTGEENGLRIRVYGDKKALAWRQEDPHFLTVYNPAAPEERWKRGNPYVAAVSPAAARCTRTPAGHPEAFLEAFANNYLNFADTIRAKMDGRAPTELELDFPDVQAGVRGMKFVEAVVASSQNGNVWRKIEANRG